jgi:hypothetical protein
VKSPIYLLWSISAAALSLYPALGTPSDSVRHRHTPDFIEYPITESYTGAPAAPQFQAQNRTWPQGDPKFREAVNDAARRGPNFAGAFTVVEISCGSGCLYMAVVDERNGSILTEMPFSSLVVGSDLARGGASLYQGLRYQRTSRLLVAEGWFNATSGPGGTLARRYYLWTGSRFRLLRSINIPNR